MTRLNQISHYIVINPVTIATVMSEQVNRENHLGHKMKCIYFHSLR